MSPDVELPNVELPDVEVIHQPGDLEQATYGRAGGYEQKPQAVVIEARVGGDHCAQPGGVDEPQACRSKRDLAIEAEVLGAAGSVATRSGR